MPTAPIAFHLLPPSHSRSEELARPLKPDFKWAAYTVRSQLHSSLALSPALALSLHCVVSPRTQESQALILEMKPGLKHRLYTLLLFLKLPGTVTVPVPGCQSLFTAGHIEVNMDFAP